MTTFWKRRILPYVLNYLIVLVLYVVFNISIGNGIDYTVLLQSFLLGGYVLNGWYVQVQLWLYVLFFCVYKSRFTDLWKSRIILILIAVYYILGMTIKLQGTYYISVILFWFGLEWAEIEDDLNALLNRNRRLSLVVGVAMAAFGVLLILIRGALDFKTIGAMITTLSDILICIGVLIVTRYVRIKWRITNWLGEHSYEIYIFQGITFILFGNVLKLRILLSCLFSFTLTIILSVLFHPVFSTVNSIFKRNKQYF